MAKKPKPSTGLGAAECARRTGLTVRALRVYEKAGLLRPPRSPTGWRMYGPAELERLSIITALKGFGLTLAQIRKSFGAAPPALAAVLDMQLRTWAARRFAADRAVSQLQIALSRLGTSAGLSVEELCELTRSTEMNNVHAVMRQLINQHITPEQEREWLTYWAQKGPEAVQSSEEERGKFRTIARDHHELMKRGAAPESAEAQAVVERSMRVWLGSSMRQRQLEQLAWNPEVTRAWVSLGSKLLARFVVPDDPDEAERLHAYMNAARAVSRSAKLLTPLVEEAIRLCAAGTPPGSVEARHLAVRYHELCKEEGYGDARLHARWISEFVDMPDVAKAGWRYLAQL